jgi:oligosaccharide repeat unit polymerase
MYLVGFVSFFLGYIIIKPNRVSVQQSVSPIKSKYQFRIKLIIFLSIISIYVLIKKSILAIPYWLSGGVGELKSSIVLDAALNTNPFLELLYSLVCRPLQIIMVIYAIIVVLGNLGKKNIVYLALILTFAGYLCSGSKFAVIEIVFMSFAYILIFTKLNFRAVVKQYSALIAGIFIILAFISILLAMKGEGFGSSAYSYLCGCMPCSDNALKNILLDENFYGLYSLHGILRALNFIPHYLGIGPDLKVVLDFVWSEIMLFEGTMYIADDIPYNAFVSMFTFFYADGGYFGVFILSMIFGLSSSYALRLAYRRPTVRSCALVLFIVLLVFQSMVRFQLTIVTSAMALIYILLLLPKQEVKILNFK